MTRREYRSEFVANQALAPVAPIDWRAAVRKPRARPAAPVGMLARIGRALAGLSAVAKF